MRIRIPLATLLLLTTTAVAQTTDATSSVDKSIDTMLGDHTKVHQLLTTLQQSVASHNATAVAALIHYPIKISPGSTHPTIISTPKAFIASYDKIITPQIASVITKQKYEDLFVNDQGAMLGSGEIWVTSTCLDKACKHTDIKIGTIQSAPK